MKKAVEDRDAGLPAAAPRARIIDDWRGVLERWVSDLKGKIRGDNATTSSWHWDTRSSG